MDELQAQITEELRRILEIAEELTGLPSRWNGTVELVPNADFKGKKRFACDIQIDAHLVVEEVRWSTLIHEALHSVSSGFNRDDYQAFRGWEEGTVEQMQRLLRPHILARLTISIAETYFADLDRFHRFQPYIEALEALRRALGGTETDAEKMRFYHDLLATPLRSRPSYLLGQAYQQSGLLRFEFVQTFSASNAILIGRPL